MKTVSPIRAQRAAKQSGFNLIEAAIVLGIVGLIVGGIWAAAGAAYEGMRQQNASKQLLSLVQGTPPIVGATYVIRYRCAIHRSVHSPRGRALEVGFDYFLAQLLSAFALPGA